MSRIRLDKISADPPAGMTKDRASKRFEALGIQYTPAGAIIAQSGVNSIML